ncbi:MAG: hypothetical protein QM817_04320 [Archangium sp.]
MIRCLPFLLLAGSGCIAVNAAGPLPAPAGGTLLVGSSLRSQSTNHWYCPSLGSIVLASDGPEYLVHLENRDWVFRVAGARGQALVEYPWFRIVSYNGPVGGIAGAVLSGIAAAQSTSGTVRLDAQTTKGGALKLTVTGNNNSKQEEQCELLP